MSNEKFLEQYERLNAEQKRAVDTIEGPVLVVAGPGTGKTQILTLRIANILAKTDVEPRNILALTFTESAAINMRRRLVSLIQSAGYYVAINTFHGFCNRLIQDTPQYFPRIIGSENATEVDQIEIVREIIEENAYTYLKPFGDTFFYTLQILGSIRDLKREGFSPEIFEGAVKKQKALFLSHEDVVHEKGPHKGKMKAEYQKELRSIEKNEELVRVFFLYVAKLQKRKLYDFEDMILEVILAFEGHADFLQEIQERYQYVLVDEHQDTNGAQNKVLDLLCSFDKSPNLFVVGDEKQAIYRFQGANVENFLSFKNRYPKAAYISLLHNYRSTQAILDAAGSVISRNRAVLAHELQSEIKERGERIKIHSFPSEEEEFYFLAQDVKRRIAEGVPAHEIAVLYRENNDVLPIGEFFEKLGVPYAVESDDNILKDQEIKKLVLLFQAIHSFGDDELLTQALHADFLQIHLLDLYTVIRERERRNVSLSLLLHDENLVRSFQLVSPEALFRVVKLFHEWKRHSVSENVLVFFERVVRESGFLEHLLKTSGSVQGLMRLNALFSEVKKMVRGKDDARFSDFVQYLEMLDEHGIRIRARGPKALHSVRCMTSHRAKGLEFDYVYMTDVVDGKWGNKRVHSHFHLPFETQVQVGELEENEDERRLFFMAMTRARKEVLISYSFHSFDGKEQVPSEFIGEIKEDFREVKEVTLGEEFNVREILYTKREKSEPGIKNEEFVRELFLSRGLSVTALNHYLKCPWQYFYTNLLRIPEAKSKHQMLGTAAHDALAEFFDAKKVGENVRVIELYEKALMKEPASRAEQQALLSKGTGILSEFVNRYEKEWNYMTENEYVIRGVEFSEGVRLLGMLDKLEIQGNGKDVIVTDYKVKKPESRNWIEGKTENSTGDYKRQLVFYMLLLQMMPHSKYRMIAGQIDFVEPNERGVFKKEMFEIDDSEVQELKEMIARVADEILNLKFWDRKCEDKECRYCRLREMTRE